MTSCRCYLGGGVLEGNPPSAINIDSAFLMRKTSRTPWSPTTPVSQHTSPPWKGQADSPSCQVLEEPNVNDTQPHFPMHAVPQILRHHAVTGRSGCRQVCKSHCFLFAKKSGCFAFDFVFLKWAKYLSGQNFTTFS